MSGTLGVGGIRSESVFLVDAPTAVLRNITKREGLGGWRAPAIVVRILAQSGEVPQLGEIPQLVIPLLAALLPRR